MCVCWGWSGGSEARVRGYEQTEETTLLRHNVNGKTVQENSQFHFPSTLALPARHLDPTQRLRNVVSLSVAHTYTYIVCQLNQLLREGEK